MSAEKIRDGEFNLPLSSMISVLRSLARFGAVLNDTELEVRDTLSGYRLPEAPDRASLSRFSGSLELTEEN